MSKTAVVIGASGLIGQHLVTLLAKSSAFEKVITITRRPLAPTAKHIENHVIDFNELDKHQGLFKADVLFCCLGTTKQQVGSLEAQYVIDVDYPVIAATLAQQQGVSHMLVVSSSGANPQSRSRYLKMKGELEASLIALDFPYLTILRPSLLLGDRPSFRLGEKIASWLLPILTLIPGLTKYRPIEGEVVARKMLQLSSQKKLNSLEILVLDQIFVG